MNKLRIILVLLFGMLQFMSCNKWTEPEFKVEDWVPPTGTLQNHFWTIGMNESGRRSVLLRHTNGTPPDSIITNLKDKIYVRAVVVSSDEGGNYYKSMVIQDSTGAVELELDQTGLYNTYPVGQKIVLVCNGLVVGDYNNLPQVGWIYQGNQVGRINSLFIDQYIIKDGLPSLKNLPKALTNNEIDFSSLDDINKLVRLENVTFKENAIGQPLAYNHFITDWIVQVPLSDGRTQEVTVRTSNYAKFRSTIIQNTEYHLTGILTIYRNSYQLMIRTKEDIEILTPELDDSVVFDFTANPLSDGWSVQPSSAQWMYRPTAQIMMHPAAKTAMDNWLISPVITYPDFANGYLRFDHQLPVVTDGDKNPYQIYYTTSTATTFNINDWKLLGNLTSFPPLFEWSNRFSLKAVNANSFRIAFRYNASNLDVETYDWSIRKVEIRK